MCHIPISNDRKHNNNQRVPYKNDILMNYEKDMMEQILYKIYRLPPYLITLFHMQVLIYEIYNQDIMVLGLYRLHYLEVSDRHSWDNMDHKSYRHHSFHEIYLEKTHSIRLMETFCHKQHNDTT